MTTNYHTAIPVNSPANASVFNAPLGQIDNALGSIVTGSQNFSLLSFASPTTLTIAAGVITPTNNVHLVESQSGTTDNLDTITATNNRFLFLKAAGGHTITLTSAGNISADNIILTGNAILILFCHNGQWSICSQSIYDNLNQRLSSNLYISGLEFDVDPTTQTIEIYEGVCASDDSSFIIDNSSQPVSNLTINPAVTGINGLDTGTIAANTWYYVWMCAGSSGVGAVLSTSVTGPTLPAGYDLYQRRIGAVRTDPIALMYGQKMVRGAFGAREVYYTEVVNASPYRILNEVNIGTSGAQTNVNCSAICPPTSRQIIAIITINTPTGTADIFWNASDGNDRYLMSLTSTSMECVTRYNLEVTWNGGQANIYSSAAVDEDLSLHVLGYIDDVIYLGYNP